jgi:Mg-chelatase subunit ChlD
MRFLMVSAAVLGALAPVSSTAYEEPPIARVAPPVVDILPPPRPQPDDRQTGLCRRAPALPQLAQEERRNQTQPPPRWTPRRDRSGKPGVARPTPIPSESYDAASPPSPALSAPPPVSARAAVETDALASKTAPAEAGRDRAVPSSSFTPPMPPAPERPQRPVQSGQLTAGEHDDLLNPSLYARYVSQFLASEKVQGIPRVDTNKVLSVVVQDSNGTPVPFATVTLRCSDGNTLALTTTADGKAVFFPELDRLGDQVSMRVNGVGQDRMINIADVRGAQEIRTQVLRGAQRATKFDLALVIDATGSMGDEIRFLKAELRSIVDALAARHRGLDIRIAMVVYRDQGDEFVTRTFEFTSDMGEVQRNLAAQSAGGGGDTPEAMEVAMVRAVGLNWRQDAVKSMLLLADAPPHSGDVPMTWTATEVARAKRIHIVPVAASGVDDAAQYIMRAMAAATQSRYAFLTDDSGIGNPHAEPSVDCYHVTKLEGLVRRILDAQISGRRIEPENREIIRTVGDYDNGKCRGA